MSDPKFKECDPVKLEELESLITDQRIRVDQAKAELGGAKKWWRYYALAVLITFAVTGTWVFVESKKLWRDTLRLSEVEEETKNNLVDELANATARKLALSERLILQEEKIKHLETRLEDQKASHLFCLNRLKLLSQESRNFLIAFRGRSTSADEVKNILSWWKEDTMAGMAPEVFFTGRHLAKVLYQFWKEGDPHNGLAQFPKH